MRPARHLLTAFGSLLLVTLPLATAVASPSQLVSDPLRYVNPMIGTGRGGDVVGDINAFPGATVPFGMIEWSPDNGNYAGYSYKGGPIKGFSLTHASVGCDAFGVVPILPMVGKLGAAPWNHREAFSHASEHASPGEYQVTLSDSHVKVTLSTTTRAGLGQFTFPASAAAHVLIKAGDSLSGDSHTTVRVVNDHEVVGSTTTGWFCSEGDGTYTAHFAITFDRPFTAHGTWDGIKAMPGADSAESHHGKHVQHKPGAGAWVSFDTRKQPVVKMKVALSYVSVAGAKKNLAEIKGWNLAQVRQQARAAWRRTLSRVQVGGASKARLTTFYTALYHSLTHPNIFDDIDGRYIGFDGKIHHVAKGHHQYANFSSWDTYRSLGALQAWLFPERASDMAQSLVNDAKQGGWLPRWPLENTYTGVMNGDNSVPLIASMHAFGATDFDAQAALKYMRKGATEVKPAHWGYIERQGVDDYVRLGYVPNDRSTDKHTRYGASETLEYAIDDFAISRLAKSLGEHQVAATYLKRSANWRHLLNPATGYLQPRFSDGHFPPGPGFVAPPKGQFGQDGYDEGNAAQYRWLVPQDIGGLVKAIGGPDKVIPALDTFFQKLNVGPNEPYQWSGNEVDFGTPWLYNYVGQPWKTQALVRRIQKQLFTPSVDGLPGNDDLGAQSSWYVWSALGLYPATPGTRDLVVNSPLFEHARLRLGNGHTLTLDAPGAHQASAYITGMRVNGKPWSRTALPDAVVTHGGQVHFQLATQPSKQWGSAPADAPPSYPAPTGK
ncbi:alpha-1,2-mannosidase [Oleiagrimonas sp. C23AA]|nr:GH92 family glycosyl hydrolase [Oleiagrimonas sp. C23AA]NII10797.1 alpha-1,2-mannosidase [Oleiagrimonas sp. C23AA]